MEYEAFKVEAQPFIPRTYLGDHGFQAKIWTERGHDT